MQTRSWECIYRGEMRESRRLADGGRVNDGRRVVVTTLDDIGRLCLVTS